MTVLHLDELRDFALRDPARLTPGTEALFVHLPVLENAHAASWRASAHAYVATVVESGEFSQNDLHPDMIVDKPWATKKDAIVRISSLNTETYRYLNDSGVIPYDSGYLNPVNFTVLLEDLKAAGHDYHLSASPAWLQAANDFNEQVEEDTFYDDARDDQDDVDYD